MQGGPSALGGGDTAGPAAAGSDDEILARLQAELSRQPWFIERNIKFSVHGGVVRMEGAVTDERTRKALWVAAQNVSGRREVDDQLELFEPMTGTVLP